MPDIPPSAKRVGIVINAIDDLMHSQLQKYITWQTFIHHPMIFPFTFDTLSQADIAAEPYLRLDRMGGDVVVTLQS